jgi:hypothetical protein
MGPEGSQFALHCMRAQLPFGPPAPKSTQVAGVPGVPVLPGSGPEGAPPGAPSPPRCEINRPPDIVTEPVPVTTSAMEAPPPVPGSPGFAPVPPQPQAPLLAD